MEINIKTTEPLPNSVSIYKPNARDIFKHQALLNNPKYWHRLAVSGKFYI